MAGERARLTGEAADRFALDGARAVIATMHGKEQVIAPVLRDAFGLHCNVAEGLDTDAFGTFARERERTGTILEAARAKAVSAPGCASTKASIWPCRPP